MCRVCMYVCYVCVVCVCVLVRAHVSFLYPMRAFMCVCALVRARAFHCMRARPRLPQPQMHHILLDDANASGEHAGGSSRGPNARLAEGSVCSLTARWGLEQQ